MKNLILGLGNLLLADEGVGVHAADALMKKRLDGNTMVVDVGTAVIDALPHIEAAQRIIIIDAMKGCGQAGSVYRTTLQDCAQNPCISSMHGFDIGRVCALASRKDLPEVIVIGIEPQRIEWSLELSESVKKALPHVLELVEQEIARPGA